MGTSYYAASQPIEEHSHIHRRSVVQGCGHITSARGEISRQDNHLAVYSDYARTQRERFEGLAARWARA
jgi:hypothetical protein